MKLRTKMNKMELHDTLSIYDIQTKDDKGKVLGSMTREVMRVPGGWLYTLQITGGGSTNVTETFVAKDAE